MKKHEIIFALLKKTAANDESIFGEGVLEILPDGFRFLKISRIQLFTRCR
jgi:transcription termination factor Rho